MMQKTQNSNSVYAGSEPANLNKQIARTVNSRDYRTALIHFVLVTEIVLFIYFVFSKVSFSSYLSGEDTLVMRTLTNGYAVTPELPIPYITPVLSRFVATLYSWFPNNPCYAYLQRLLIIASMVIININTFRQLEKHALGRGYIASAIISVIMDCLLGWTFARLHRYFVAGIACAAAVSLIFSWDPTEKRFWVSSAVVLLLFSLSMGFAQELRIALLCLLLLGMAFKWLQMPKSKNKPGKGMRRLIAVSALLIVFAIASMLITNVGWNKSGRIAFSAENPGENVSLVKAQSIVEQSKAVEEELSSSALIGNNVLNHTKRQATGIMIVIIGLLVICRILYLKKRSQRFFVLYVVACTAWLGLFCALLKLQGRLNILVFISLLIPYAVYTITLVVKIGCLGLVDSQKRRKNRRVLSKTRKNNMIFLTTVIMLSCCCIYGVFCYAYLHNEEDQEYYKAEQVKEQKLYGYVRQHKSNVYVLDRGIVNARYPFTVIKNGDLSNLRYSWGDMDIYLYPLIEQSPENKKLWVPRSSFDYTEENVYFITDSESNIKRLYTALNSRYGINRLMTVDEMDDGLKVIKFLAPGDSINEEEYYIKGWPNDRKDYKIYYHFSESAPASESVSYGSNGVTVQLRTIESLRFSKSNKMFMGWRVYRPDTHCWYVTDEEGTVSWNSAIPENGDYYVCREGEGLKINVDPGAEIHLYAQWNLYYSIYFYESDDSPVSKEIKIPYMIQTDTPTYQDLGFSMPGKVFKGWKVYHPMSDEWLVIDKDGKQTWKKDLDEGTQFKLYENGCMVWQTAEPGQTICFYAEWEDAHTGNPYYTILFYESDDSLVGVEIKFPYMLQTYTPTYQELGFGIPGKVFKGWKVYRPDSDKWYVIDKNGKKTWKKRVNDSTQFKLYKNGCMVRKTAQPWQTVCFYGEWEDA